MNPTILSRSRVPYLSLVEEPLRVLLAEEDPLMQRLMTFVLRRDRHEVVAKTNGSAVLEALSSELLDERDRHFDVIISDENLPGLPGLAILASLRAWRQETPFVLITDNWHVQRQALDLGALILNHPLNLQAIRNVLRACAQACSRMRPSPVGASRDR